MSKLLYLGLDPSRYNTEKEIIHCPLIQIIPRDICLNDIQKAFSSLPEYTHLIFTSKSSVSIFFEALKHLGIAIETLESKIFISIGEVTTSFIQSHGNFCVYQAEEFTQEGVITLLEKLSEDKLYLFYPKSSLARDRLASFLLSRGWRHLVLDLYDTKFRIDPRLPLLLNEVDEVVFTSPSTVDAFLKNVDSIPSHLRLTSLGPITQRCLNRALIVAIHANRNN